MFNQSQLTMSNTTIEFTGKSGKKYQFYVYELNTSFNKEGGNYVFTKRTTKQDGSGSHDIIYIGKTEDLSTRFQNHHKEDCISKHGANRICIRQVDSENERDLTEKDLIKNYNSVCNDQLTD